MSLTDFLSTSSSPVDDKVLLTMDGHSEYWDVISDTRSVLFRVCALDPHLEKLVFWLPKIFFPGEKVHQFQSVSWVLAKLGEIVEFPCSHFEGSGETGYYTSYFGSASTSFNLKVIVAINPPMYTFCSNSQNAGHAVPRFLSRVEFSFDETRLTDSSSFLSFIRNMCDVPMGSIMGIQTRRNFCNVEVYWNPCITANWTFDRSKQGASFEQKDANGTLYPCLDKGFRDLESTIMFEVCYPFFSAT